MRQILKFSMVFLLVIWLLFAKFCCVFLYDVNIYFNIIITVFFFMSFGQSDFLIGLHAWIKYQSIWLEKYGRISGWIIYIHPWMKKLDFHPLFIHFSSTFKIIHGWKVDESEWKVMIFKCYKKWMIFWNMDD